MTNDIWSKQQNLKLQYDALELALWNLMVAWGCVLPTYANIQPSFRAGCLVACIFFIGNCARFARRAA